MERKSLAAKKSHYFNPLLQHRIIECQGLEGTLKIIEPQSPCHGQKYFPVDQIAQGLIQPSFECYLGWGIHNLLGKSVLAPHHPNSKEFLPNT